MGRGVDPARPVVGESAGGDEAVNVGMKVEVLAPGVKEGDKTDVGPQMFGIGGDGGECGPHGLKQKVVDWFWVLECEGSQGVGDREDDVEIGNRQEVLEPVVDPAMAKGGLAFGAVAVTAGVVGNALMTTGIAGVDMAAQVGGAAMGNGVEYSVLQGGQRK